MATWAGVVVSGIFGYLSYRSSRKSAAERKLAEDAYNAVKQLAGETKRVADAAENQLADARQYRVEQREEGIREQQALEQRLGESLTVKCYGGGGSTSREGRPGSMSTVHIEISNASDQVATIDTVELPGVALAGTDVQELLGPLPPGQSKRKDRVAAGPFEAPDDEFGGRPLSSPVPVITYRVGGIAWRRQGDQTPQRLGRP